MGPPPFWMRFMAVGIFCRLNLAQQGGQIGGRLDPHGVEATHIKHGKNMLFRAEIAEADLHVMQHAAGTADPAAWVRGIAEIIIRLPAHSPAGPDKSLEILKREPGGSDKLLCEGLGAIAIGKH